MRQYLLTAALLFTVPAQAVQIDLSTSTCKSFVEGDQEEIKTTLAWLDGYYKEEDDPPVIDSDKLVENAGKLGEYCRKNPTIGLITAADKILAK